MGHPAEVADQKLPAMERIGAFIFAWRNLIFSVVTIGLLAVLRPVPLGGSPSMDRWLDAAGLAIILSGQALRAAVIGYAYIKRGGKDGKVYAPRLVTEGFFSHSRNPLYVGNVLVLAGLFIIHNNPWAYGVGLPLAIFFYAAIVAAEEAYLRCRFGAEYADYCRRVPRWMPRLKDLGRSLAGMEFNWWRVVNKEYTSTYSWIAGVLALLAYQEITTPSLPQPAAYFKGLGALFLGVTVIWCSVRYVKKTERKRAQRKAAGA
jgi:protein-S-isoprenylcysteine O-methyltransferase Ste14